MLVEVLSHNTETFMAEIRFTHNGVVVQDTYNLLFVEPTMKATLERVGQPFSLQMQQETIDRLTAWIQRNIERGGLTNIEA